MEWVDGWMGWDGIGIHRFGIWLRGLMGWF
jgi:hypothetical protein